MDISQQSVDVDFVCLDEAIKQLVAETRTTIRAEPRKPKRFDELKIFKMFYHNVLSIAMAKFFLNRNFLGRENLIINGSIH